MILVDTLQDAFIIKCNVKLGLNLCFTHKNTNYDMLHFKQDVPNFNIYFDSYDVADKVLNDYLDYNSMKESNKRFVTIQRRNTDILNSLGPFYKIKTIYGVYGYVSKESFDLFINKNI